MTMQFEVTGMTCGGCERSVREAVSQVPGVVGVEVSAQAGRLLVSADEAVGVVDEAAVITAVDQAGYAAIPEPR